VEKANTLAYCITATITALKSFIVEAPGNVDTTCPKNKLECFSAASLITKMKNYSYWTLLSPEPDVRNLLQSAFMNVHKKLECLSLAGLYT